MDFNFNETKKIHFDQFLFVLNPQGKGRVGISISKKAIRSAVGRNRIKRLIRDSFRREKEKFETKDLHVVGRIQLSKRWKEITQNEVDLLFTKAMK